MLAIEFMEEIATEVALTVPYTRFLEVPFSRDTLRPPDQSLV